MNKVAIITGASRGIGAATARLAAAHGYAVCVNFAMNAAAAAAVVEDIRAGGGRALAVQADVSREEDVIQLFEIVDRELGTPSALVNNAGVLERQTTVAGMTVERLERVFRTNVIGAFLCCREAVRRMSSAFGGKGGAIVNVGSAASRLGAAGEYVDYAASKGALDSLTIGLAQEVAPYGVRVNAVRPAFIYTDIHASGGEPGRVDRVKASVPLRRGGQPEEVAEAILWLLSERASYTSGAFIEVSGGR
ncbi:MAG TPA: SDR family oxidoreductase [Burkholderiales bacterium]|nr:SDR family oxidoreductase [Burkholderiales bacterium]